MNSKVIALAVAAWVAGGAAYAQSNPPGAAVPPNTPGIASGKAERAGEARKDARPSGMVKKPGGDQATTPEGGAIGADKAAASGERRAETRDTRRPNKRKSTQGGTPPS